MYDLCQTEVCPQQLGLEADCFLKQASALRKPLLLKSDGTEDGTSGRTSLRIGKSNLSLLICLLSLPSCTKLAAFCRA